MQLGCPQSDIEKSLIDTMPTPNVTTKKGLTFHNLEIKNISFKCHPSNTDAWTASICQFK